MEGSFLEGKLNKREAARYLGVKPKTLDNWLWQKIAPRNFKYLNRLYFDPKDLDAFKRSLITVRSR